MAKFDDQYTRDKRENADADAWLGAQGLKWSRDVLSADQLLDRRRREIALDPVPDINAGKQDGPVTIAASFAEDARLEAAENPPVYLSDVFADGVWGMTVPDSEKLRRQLANGPLEAKEVVRRMGWSHRKLSALKAELGIESVREGFGPGSRVMWRLPYRTGEHLGE